MENNEIKIKNLSKLYDDHHAVKNLTLSINKGEIFGLLGPNGAGKTTTILMLLGLIEPSDGEVSVCGFQSTTEPLKVKKRVGYLPDHLGFYQHLTGYETLMYTARLNELPERVAEERAKYLLNEVGLVNSADKNVGKYSRGMKQRLGLADVLMKDPEIIILDEPTLGIDPEGVQEILKFIQRLNEEQQLTILLSSHHLHQVQAICHRVGLFVAGELLAEGTIDTLSEKLLEEDDRIVSVKVKDIDQLLIKDIQTIDGVTNIKERENNQLDIYCQKHITEKIAARIVQQGYALSYIDERDYGLDEIYHQYFGGCDYIGAS